MAYYEGIGLKDEGCSNFVVNCYNNVIVVTNITGNTATTGFKGSYGFNLYENPYAPNSHITLWGNTVTPQDQTGFPAFAFFNQQPTAIPLATNITILSGIIQERPVNLSGSSADVTNQTAGCVIGYENLHRSDGLPLTEKNGPASHRSMFYLTPNSPLTTFNNPGYINISNNWVYSGPIISNYLSGFADNTVHWLNSSNGLDYWFYISNGVFTMTPAHP